MKVQAEISLYPLRTQDLSRPIDAFVRTIVRGGVKARPGAMSTRLEGEAQEVFTALQRAFTDAARNHQVVLTVKLSNACPRTRTRRKARRVRRPRQAPC